jgi:hypothetical protein
MNYSILFFSSLFIWLLRFFFFLSFSFQLISPMLHCKVGSFSAWWVNSCFIFRLFGNALGQCHLELINRLSSLILLPSFIKVLSVQGFGLLFGEVGRLGLSLLFLRLLLVQWLHEGLLLLGELLLSDCIIDLWLEGIEVYFTLLRRHLLLLLLMHLHPLRQLGFLVVEFWVLSDPLLSFLLLLPHHLVEYENGAWSGDRVGFECRFPQIVC